MTEVIGAQLLSNKSARNHTTAARLEPGYHYVPSCQNYVSSGSWSWTLPKNHLLCVVPPPLPTILKTIEKKKQLKTIYGKWILNCQFKEENHCLVGGGSWPYSFYISAENKHHPYASARYEKYTYDIDTSSVLENTLLVKFTQNKIRPEPAFSLTLFAQSCTVSENGVWASFWGRRTRLSLNNRKTQTWLAAVFNLALFLWEAVIQSF